MKLSAPKKWLYFVSLILALLGIIIYLLGYLLVLTPVPIWELLGFVLVFVAWLLLFIGVSFKGI